MYKCLGRDSNSLVTQYVHSERLRICIIVIAATVTLVEVECPITANLSYYMHMDEGDH